MTGVFSINDVFLCGTGMDLAGAVLLARGLLVQPRDLARRRTPTHSRNPPAAELFADASDAIDARLGLTCLVLGFLIQAVGSAVGVVDVATRSGGPSSLVVAIGSASAGGLAAVVLRASTRRSMLKRWLVELAHFNLGDGSRELTPDTYLLMLLGRYAGWGAVLSDAAGTEGQYCEAVFGVRGGEPRSAPVGQLWPRGGDRG